MARSSAAAVARVRQRRVQMPEHPPLLPSTKMVSDNDFVILISNISRKTRGDYENQLIPWIYRRLFDFQVSIRHGTAPGLLWVFVYIGSLWARSHPGAQRRACSIDRGLGMPTSEMIGSIYFHLRIRRSDTHGALIQPAATSSWLA